MWQPNATLRHHRVNKLRRTSLLFWPLPLISRCSIIWLVIASSTTITHDVTRIRSLSTNDNKTCQPCDTHVHCIIHERRFTPLKEEKHRKLTQATSASPPPVTVTNQLKGCFWRQAPRCRCCSVVRRTVPWRLSSWCRSTVGPALTAEATLAALTALGHCVQVHVHLDYMRMAKTAKNNM